ncbi:unnamed protein product [Rhizoctonia solani]|nr:unnamed protein product [Rhizoctonia solani]
MTFGKTEQGVLVDLEDIAATIALASNALDTAANALTGTAGAVSDACGILEILRSELAKPTHGAAPLTKGPYELDSNDEVEINKGSLDQMSENGENGEVDDQQSTFGPDSESDGLVTSSLPHRSSGKQVAVPQSRSIPNETEDYYSEDSKLGDKIDTLPSSSIMPYLGTQEMLPILSPELAHSVSDEQWDPSRLHEVMKLQYSIPAGRNYIYLDQSSDGLAFIAYMALQATRVICIVPDYSLDAYSRLLKSLTHASVHRLHTPEQFSHVSETIDPSSYNIFFIPSSQFSLGADVFALLSPDCIIHWGQPASTFYCSVLDSLPPTMQTCVILTGEDGFNGELYGTEPYTDSVLDACFSANSPFQLLCDASAKFLLEAHHSARNAYGSGSRITVSQLEANLLMRASGISTDLEQFEPRNLLPAGHYYIVLDKPHDYDFMALIAYVALDSAKVLCHIPNSKNLASYERLINLVTGIKVIVSSTVKNKHKVATRQLRSATNAVLLRSLIPDWCSFVRSSLVDSVIHRGTPKDLTKYMNDCRTKVQRSYLVLNKRQYSSIRRKLDSNHWIQEHPHIRASEFSRTGSSLNNLRNQLTSHV